MTYKELFENEARQNVNLRQDLQFKNFFIKFLVGIIVILLIALWLKYWFNFDLLSGTCPYISSYCE